MYWPNAYRLPKWILTATAAAMLAVPVVAQDQSGLSPATGKPALKTTTKPVVKPKTRPTAPAVPPADDTAAVTQASGTAPVAVAQGTATDGETAVQKELRRLYQESGREAPEVPTPSQVQSINGRSAAQPAPQIAPYGSYGAAPQRVAAAPAPAPSAPVRSSSRNPVVGFFQRLTGRDSKPVNNAPVPGTTGPVMNPTISMRQAPPPARNYAPYNGTQPQRLPEPMPANPQPVVTNPVVPAPTAVAAKPMPRVAKPVAQPVKPAAPPTAVNVAERLQLDRDVATAAPERVRAEVIAAPQAPVTPVITGPSAEPSFAARPNPEAEPVFEEPVMVDAAESSPFEAPLEAELGPEAPMPAVGAEVAAAEANADFPEPFSEEDEKEADEEAMESPFSGLALDEEPLIVAQTIPQEANPQTETLAEPAPLSVPETTATTTPAPATAAVEPEFTAPIEAQIVEPPVATAQPIEDDEFFPADVAKPIAEAPANDQPALTLPETPIVATPTLPAPTESTDAYAVKMQKIKERGGMKGLKGFCPVTLRDERELKDAKPEFHSQFRGQKFHFASTDAKAKFDAAPASYAPAAYGADVVVLIRDKDVAEGTLDYAAWFKGQLYLFSSEETHAVFSDDPAKFAAPAGLE